MKLTNISELNKLFNEETKFYVSELLREKLKNKNTHIGMPLEDLKEIYKENTYLDYKFFNKNYWWVDLEDKDYNLDFSYESWENFDLRMYIFLIFLSIFEQKKILIVSHSKIGKFLLNKEQNQTVSQEMFHFLDMEMIFTKLKQFIESFE